VAYDVLKAIYLERGYQPRAIPRLILEQNLYGLDIDDRAAQLAGFALMMKARADDRRLFNEPVHLNVMALQSSQGLDAETIAHALTSALLPRPLGEGGGEGFPQATNDLTPDDLFPDTYPQMSLGESVGTTAMSGDATLTRPTDNALQPTIAALIATFEHAKTFGSLIQIPPQLNAGVHKLLQTVQQIMESGDLYAQAAAQDVWPLLRQAQVLAMQFDAVVANPPYMGGKGMNSALKDYAKATFPDSKSDLFAMFMERGFGWCKPSGFNSMVTMQSWMFLSSYEALRSRILNQHTILTMAHLGARAFDSIGGEVVSTTAFVLGNMHKPHYQGAYMRLVGGNSEAEKMSMMTKAIAQSKLA
jgi:type II restriction/modification system DNA methylase subunit YeeA